MTESEARAAVIAARPAINLVYHREAFEEALDAYRVAVEADMDCRYWAFNQTCPKRWLIEDLEKWCRSCQAREQMEKAGGVHA